MQKGVAGGRALLLLEVLVIKGDRALIALIPSRSGQHGYRILQIFDDGLQQLRAKCAVDDPVVN